MLNVNTVAKLFYTNDPARLGSVENSLYDEYDVEAVEFADKIDENPKQYTSEEILSVLNEVFVYYFSESIEFDFSDTLIEELKKAIND